MTLRYTQGMTNPRADALAIATCVGFAIWLISEIFRVGHPFLMFLLGFVFAIITMAGAVIRLEESETDREPHSPS